MFPYLPLLRVRDTIGILLHFEVEVQKIPSIAQLILKSACRGKNAFVQKDVSRQLP